jgi:hypothetical protein
MLDALKIMKDEIFDEVIQKCKKLVDDLPTQMTIIFICNTRTATRHLVTIPTQMMYNDDFQMGIESIAFQADADAILSVVTASDIDGQRCMTVAVETLLDRYVMVYPYTRLTGGMKVVWEESRQMDLPGRYGDLLPPPIGMAQA